MRITDTTTLSDEWPLPEPLRAASRTEVWFGRRRLAYFGGCDYYRFSTHPKVVAAAGRAARNFGLGVAASRRTTGNHPIFGRLEAELADFFGGPAALLTGSGYVTNLVVAQALASDFTHLLLDEGAHPSLQDAATMLSSTILRYRPGDVADAIRQQKRLPRGARCLLLTDGINPTGGGAAPLAELRAGLRDSTWFLVDDCHGLGTVGPGGRGTVAHAAIGGDRVIQTGTLSKAFGSFGGFILAPKALIPRLVGTRIFAGSTPPPMPHVEAARKSLALLRQNPALPDRLRQNADSVKGALLAAGRIPAVNLGPICRVVPRDASDEAGLRRRLLRAGIFPTFIRYPGLPAGGAYRFGVSTEHSADQLQSLVDAVTG